jgi:hypothetical protein
LRKLEFKAGFQFENVITFLQRLQSVRKPYRHNKNNSKIKKCNILFQPAFFLLSKFTIVSGVSKHQGFCVKLKLGNVQPSIYVGSKLNKKWKKKSPDITKTEESLKSPHIILSKSLKLGLNMWQRNNISKVV